MHNTDYTYCPGTECPIRETCKRYIDPFDAIDEILWWTSPWYEKQKGSCDLFDEKEE